MFSRILLITKLTKKQLAKRAIKNLCLDFFGSGVYTRLTQEELNNFMDYLDGSH